MCILYYYIPFPLVLCCLPPQCDSAKGFDEEGDLKDIKYHCDFIYMNIICYEPGFINLDP